MIDLLRAKSIRSEQKLIAEFTDEDMILLGADRKKCQQYVREQRWCVSVESAIAAYSIPRVVSVFLVSLTPRDGADAVLWCIVGDLPSAYLVLDDAPAPAQALEIYVELMEDWVRAVRAGSDLDDVFPVDADPSLEHAAMLESRMQFLRSEIIPYAKAHWDELVAK